MHPPRHTKSRSTPTTLALITALIAASHLPTHPAQAQLAEYSLRGFLDTTTNEQTIPFTLSREVTDAEATANPDTIKFLTLHHSGGTNHAGTMIPPGSFDADLELRDSTNALIAFNEDSGTGSDARLNFTTGSPPIPAPIGPGDFTLHMTKIPTTDKGPWALDIQAPSDAISLTLPGNIGPASGTPGLTHAFLQSGAQWQVPADLKVGNQGTGNLTIRTGANVSNTTGTIGSSAGSTGTVNVNRATWTNTSDLWVGFAGSGTLNIGIIANVSNTTGSIAGFGSSTGTVNLSSGIWNNTDGLYVGGRSTSPGGTGTLNVTGGNLNVTGTLKLWEDTDTLDHTGGTITIKNGTFEPLPAAGDYTLSAPDNPKLVLDNSTLDTGTDDLIIGNSNTESGTLTIKNGADVSNTFGYIGRFAVSTGTVTVDNATWTNAGTLLIGDLGTGTLTIKNGADVSNTAAEIGNSTGSTSTVTVNNATWTNSESLRIGDFGTGTLTIKNGADVSNTSADIGNFSTATGTVTVDNATWTNAGALNIGFFGHGSLTIKNGADVSNTSATIGIHNNSTGTVTVDNATWTNAGDLNIGFFGHGSLTIKNGAIVSNTAGSIGRSTGSTGTVTVDGPGTTWNNTNLYVGGSDTAPGGTGTLTVKGNALVNAGDTLKIWNTGQVDLAGGSITAQQIDNTDAGLWNWFAGTVNITGPLGLTLSPDNIGTNIAVDPNSALNVTNTLTVPTAAILNIAGGGLNVGAAIVQPAATMIAANTTINLGAGLTNNSTLTLIDTTVNGPVTSPAGSAITVVGTVNFNDLVSGAAGFFGPGTAVFNGGHDPGDSPAAVPVEGNLTYTPTNTLFIELAGTTPGAEHDQLNITNNVSLDGTLNIQRLDDYTPTLGDTFTILTYATRTPSSFFNKITNTLIDTTLALAPLLNETTNQLTLQALIPGDLNRDNKVSIADLSTFALNFGTTPGLYNELDMINSWQLGDFNTDGQITVADLSLLALNFGFDATDPTAPPTPLSLTDAATLAGLDPATLPAVPEPATATAITLLTTIPLLTRTRRRAKTIPPRYNN